MVLVLVKNKKGAYIMARIKINDLPKDMKISKEEMKNVVGGAADCFLNIDGIPGESTDEAHTDWIKVMPTVFRTTGGQTER